MKKDAKKLIKMLLRLYFSGRPHNPIWATCKCPKCLAWDECEAISEIVFTELEKEIEQP